MLPLLELATVAALWRAMRLQQRADFIVAGVFIGVSQYAYIVARAFPVALAGALLAALVVPGSVLRHNIGVLADADADSRNNEIRTLLQAHGAPQCRHGCQLQQWQQYVLRSLWNKNAK